MAGSAAGERFFVEKGARADRAVEGAISSLFVGGCSDIGRGEAGRFLTADCSERIRAADKQITSRSSAFCFRVLIFNCSKLSRNSSTMSSSKSSTSCFLPFVAPSRAHDRELKS